MNRKGHAGIGWVGMPMDNRSDPLKKDRGD